MTAAVSIEGFREFQNALVGAERDLRLGFRQSLKEAAEPVRADAERLAVAEVRNIGPDWSQARTGVTKEFVYVVPRQRGRRNNQDPKKRPRLAPILMEKAYLPALENNHDEVLGRVEHLLEKLARDFG